MELVTLHKRVVGLDVHQAKITACLITEDDAGTVTVELAEFGGFKRDRKAMAQWVADHPPEMVVMESTVFLLEKPLRRAVGRWYGRHGRQCPTREERSRPQD